MNKEDIEKVLNLQGREFGLAANELISNLQALRDKTDYVTFNEFAQSLNLEEELSDFRGKVEEYETARLADIKAKEDAAKAATETVAKEEAKNAEIPSFANGEKANKPKKKFKFNWKQTLLGVVAGAALVMGLKGCANYNVKKGTVESTNTPEPTQEVTNTEEAKSTVFADRDAIVKNGQDLLNIYRAYGYDEKGADYLNMYIMANYDSITDQDLKNLCLSVDGTFSEDLYNNLIGSADYDETTKTYSNFKGMNSAFISTYIRAYNAKDFDSIKAMQDAYLNMYTNENDKAVLQDIFTSLETARNTTNDPEKQKAAIIDVGYKLVGIIQNGDATISNTAKLSALLMYDGLQDGIYANIVEQDQKLVKQLNLCRDELKISENGQTLATIARDQAGSLSLKLQGFMKDGSCNFKSDTQYEVLASDIDKGLIVVIGSKVNTTVKSNNTQNSSSTSKGGVGVTYSTQTYTTTTTTQDVTTFDASTPEQKEAKKNADAQNAATAEETKKIESGAATGNTGGTTINEDTGKTNTTITDANGNTSTIDTSKSVEDIQNQIDKATGHEGSGSASVIDTTTGETVKNEDGTDKTAGEVMKDNAEAVEDANKKFEEVNKDLTNDGWTETTPEVQSNAVDSNADIVIDQAQEPVIQSIEVPAEASVQADTPVVEFVEAPAATQEVTITDTPDTYTPANISEVVGQNQAAVQEVPAEDAMVK